MYHIEGVAFDNTQAVEFWIQFYTEDESKIKGSPIYLDEIGTYSDMNTFVSNLTQPNVSFGNYTVTQDNIITKLSNDTTNVLQFKNNLIVKKGAKIYFDNGASSLGEQDKIGTGTKIRVNAYGTNGYSEYTALLYGDTNGDGNITVNDLANIKGYLLKNVNLMGMFFAASDVSKNGSVTVTDLLTMKKHLLNITALVQ
jgi:hypothetical protein